MSACKGMINVIDACRAAERRQPDPRVELGGLSDAAAGADRRERAAVVPDPAQPALFLRRRQDHQRTDGDQLRPQVFRARADLPAAQCLWPGHGLRACHSAVRVAPASAQRRAARAARCRSTSRATARRPAASATSTIWCAACMVMRDKGEHLGIYHVGTTEEVTIADVARRIAAACRPRDRDRQPAGCRPAARRAAARTFRKLAAAGL